MQLNTLLFLCAQIMQPRIIEIAASRKFDLENIIASSLVYQLIIRPEWPSVQT